MRDDVMRDEGDEILKFRSTRSFGSVDIRFEANVCTPTTPENSTTPAGRGRCYLTVSTLPCRDVCMGVISRRRLRMAERLWWRSATKCMRCPRSAVSEHSTLTP